MSSGTEPRVLDVLRVTLTTSRPSRHQPENWLVGSEAWSLIETPADVMQRKTLAAIQTSPALFGDVKDRLECDFLRRRPAAASLTLVAPRSIS